MSRLMLGRWEAVMAESTVDTQTGPRRRERPRPLGWLRRTFGPNPEEEATLSQIEDPAVFRLGASILAVVVTAIAIAGSLLIDDEGDDGYSIGLVLVTGIPWVLRFFGVELQRLVFAAWVLLPTIVLSIVGVFTESVRLDGPGMEFSFGAQISLFLVLLMLADFVGAPRPQAVGITLAVAAAIALRFAVDRDPPSLLIWIAALGFTVAAAVGIRNSSVALIRARDALAAERASAERRTIARDVHDVVAHTLAVTMLHMTAARMAVQRGASDDAVEALEEAEKHGRASLTDVRRIIRVLRSDDESALDAAQPDLADVAALVDRYRSAGLDVVLRAHGSTEQVSASTGLAVYRITQEALANAARHGDCTRGVTTVDLRVADGDVTLQVRNPTQGRRSSDGHGTGLVGMRERVLAAGGTLSAEAQNGTWVVRAALPVSAEEPTR
jgi:signal transduction histidine kinase